MSTRNDESPLRHRQDTAAPMPDEERTPLPPSLNASKNITVDANRSAVQRRDEAMPLRFVIDSLKTEVDTSELYADLLLFIPFLILFIFFFLAGRDVESNYYVIQGMRDRLFNLPYPDTASWLTQYQTQVTQGQRLWIELDKNYAGIGNNGDWPLWVQFVLFPVLWDCNNVNNTYEFSAPLGQNYLLGALRIRTQRVTDASCSVRSEFYPNNVSLVSRNCYEALSESTEKRDPFLCNYSNPTTGEQMYQYKKCSDVPGVPTVGIEGIYHCGGYSFDVPFNASCANVNQLNAILTDSNKQCEQFTNERNTRFVMHEFFMYTPSSDTFHSIKFFSEVLNPGWWFNEWYTRSFTVWSDDQRLQTLVDVVLFLYVLYYWFIYFLEMVRHVRQERGTILSYLFDFWNLLELTNLVTFMVTFGFRFSWYAVSAQADSTLKLPMDPVYPPYLDKIQTLYEGVTYTSSVITVLIFLKVLKYVRLNPRLNLLTRTIAEAQQSLFGVLILFFTIVIGYAISGWALFGVNVERYRNFGVAFSAQLRQLVGDIDYDSIKQENRFLAGLFFWSYIILALFLLLNFIVAIISDSFARVSGKAVSTPLDETIVRWLHGMRKLVRCVNLKRMVVNYFQGKSEAKLLRAVVAQLDEHYLISYDRLCQVRNDRLREESRIFGGDAADFDLDNEEDDDDAEVQVMIRFDDLPVLIETSLFEDLTLHFWDYTWEKLMNEQEDAKKASEEVTKRRMAETVQLSVEKVLGDDLARVEQLDEALQRVEAEVERILASVPGNQYAR